MLEQAKAREMALMLEQANAREAKAREIMKITTQSCYPMRHPSGMMKLEEAPEGRYTVIICCHPMAMIARLRTAQRSDESQNEDKDTFMTIDLKDFYLNTSMGRNENEEEKKLDENEEEEKLDNNGDYKNCSIHGYENTVIIRNWGECFLNPQSDKYDRETVEKFYQNNTSFQCEV